MFSACGLVRPAAAPTHTDQRFIVTEFEKEVVARIAEMRTDRPLVDAAKAFMLASTPPKYSYNFFWLGRPIIQYPQDIVAVQELIWAVKPDLIVETGIAHGGSLVMSASMLALLDVCDALAGGKVFNPAASRRKVVGIDVDIRAHNRAAIEAHPLAAYIEMIEASSTAPEIVERVGRLAQGYERVLVFLDSNHTHAHVLAELEAYAPLVTKGSYCIVFDTIVEDLPKSMYPNRSWGPGDNPKTAVRTYLRAHPEFEVDASIHDKLQITVAPEGYLRRVR
jgi:cephalosporin hydroxylase